MYVNVSCDVLPKALGGFAWPGYDIERVAVGIASIDPYRGRLGG